MKKLKNILILISIILISSCSSIKTTIVESFEWNMVEQDYISRDDVYRRVVDIKFNKILKKIIIEIEDKNVKYSINVNNVIKKESYKIYNGYLDNNPLEPIRLVHFKREGTIFLYENMSSDNKRYKNFVALGN